MTRPTPNEVRDARDTLNSPVATEADQDAAADVFARHLYATQDRSEWRIDSQRNDAPEITAPARIGWLGWAMILGAAVALAIVGGSAFGAVKEWADHAPNFYGVTP